MYSLERNHQVPTWALWILEGLWKLEGEVVVSWALLLVCWMEMAVAYWELVVLMTNCSRDQNYPMVLCLHLPLPLLL